MNLLDKLKSFPLFVKINNLKIRNKILFGFLFISVIFIVPLFVSTSISQSLAETNQNLVNHYSVIDSTTYKTDILFENQLSILKTYVSGYDNQSALFNASNADIEKNLGVLYNLTSIEADSFAYHILQNLSTKQVAWKNFVLESYFSSPSQSHLLQLKNLTELIESNMLDMYNSIVTNKLTLNNTAKNRYNELYIDSIKITDQLTDQIQNLKPINGELWDTYRSLYSSFSRNYNSWRIFMDDAQFSAVSTVNSSVEWVANNSYKVKKLQDSFLPFKTQIVSDLQISNSYLNEADQDVKFLLADLANIREYSSSQMNRLKNESLVGAAFVFIFNVFGIILAPIAAVFFGFLFARLISKPLAKLMMVADSIAEGDLTTNLELSETQGRDEIFEITVSFSKMVAFLLYTIDEIKRIGLILANSSTDLATSTVEIKSSSEEISIITQQLSKGAQEQTIQISKTKTSALTLRDRFNQEIARINEATKLIEQISTQVNMLALNASIEAARAGEYGRGFSVVADNIRKLATSTKSSVFNVQEIITSLQNTLSLSIDEINESIDVVASVAEETASGSEESSAATEEQAATMDEFTVSTQKLADIARELQGLIDNFKIKKVKEEK